MSALTRSRSAAALPGQTAESCPHCHQSYVYELEVRCVDCDGPMCPLCVVELRGRVETWCPGCPPDAGEETD